MNVNAALISSDPPGSTSRVRPLHFSWENSYLAYYDDTRNSVCGPIRIL